MRLHRQDENDVRSVSALLGHLRELNRTYDLAILLVHHTAKKERAHPGQALRGSGDIYAWLDAGLYLAKKRSGIHLTIEHRSAPAAGPFVLSLQTEHDGAARLIVSESDRDEAEEPDAAADLTATALEEIANSRQPLTRSALRNRLGVRNERLGAVLGALERRGRIERSYGGWRLRAQPQRRPEVPTLELPFP